MMSSKQHIILITIGLSFLGCGKNPFSSFDEKDPAVEATLELESDNPEKAILILLNALGDDFKTIYDDIDETTDQQTAIQSLSAEITSLVEGGKPEATNLASILATAKAQTHGIDPFKLALRFADNASSSNSEPNQESNELTLLFPILPEATAYNVSGLDKALTVLNAIGSYKTTAEDYKQALLMTASIALTTKLLDADGDGVISPQEAITLSDDVAEILLNQIANAAISAAAGAGADGESSSVSAEQIQKIQSEIEAQDGATQEEKLKNFIAQNSQ